MREVDDRGESRSYRYEVGGDSVGFELPIAAVASDLALSGEHPVDALVQARASAVRAWAVTRPDVRVDVEVAGGKLKYSVEGPPGQADRAIREAQRVSETARTAFLQAHGYEDAGGLIRPAHARLVAQYAAAVAPVAVALGHPFEPPEAFAARALAWVQAIPYERRAGEGDTYRRPLAVIDEDRGDCDSKAVLYLALVMSAFPQVDTALFYIPNHLYVGLDLPGAGTRVEMDGRSWLVAEPAGPGTFPLGRLDERHEAAEIVEGKRVSPSPAP